MSSMPPQNPRGHDPPAPPPVRSPPGYDQYQQPPYQPDHLADEYRQEAPAQQMHDGEAGHGAKVPTWLWWVAGFIILGLLGALVNGATDSTGTATDAAAETTPVAGPSPASIRSEGVAVTNAVTTTTVSTTATTSSLDGAQWFVAADATTITAAPTTTAVPATIAAVPATTAAASATTAFEPSCDPNYGGCVPVASDVDCAGGDGDGPAYLEGTAEVVGQDVYGLDRDQNGIACD